jgi:hypothetical protein
MAKHKKTPPAFMRKGKADPGKSKPPMTEMPKRMHGKRGA